MMPHHILSHVLAVSFAVTSSVPALAQTTPQTAAGAPKGVAPLNDNGIVPSANLPNIPTATGTITLFTRSASSSVVALGTLVIGNNPLAIGGTIQDTNGVQPNPGDFCLASVAAGSSLPAGVSIMGPCVITAAGQVSVLIISTIALTALQSGNTKINIQWSH